MSIADRVIFAFGEPQGRAGVRHVVLGPRASRAVRTGHTYSVWQNGSELRLGDSFLARDSLETPPLPHMRGRRLATWLVRWWDAEHEGEAP